MNEEHLIQELEALERETPLAENAASGSAVWQAYCADMTALERQMPMPERLGGFFENAEGQGTADEVDTENVPAQKPHTARWLRILGWASAAAVLVVAVTIGIRHRSQAQPGTSNHVQVASHGHEGTALESVGQEPAAQEPAASKLVVQEPAAQELAVQEPAAQTPSAGLSAELAATVADAKTDLQETVAGTPAAETPAVVGTPAVETPATETPATENPAVVLSSAGLSAELANQTEESTLLDWDLPDVEIQHMGQTLRQIRSSESLSQADQELDQSFCFLRSVAESNDSEMF